MFERADVRSAISTGSEMQCAGSEVSSRLSVWVWTDDWIVNKQRKTSENFTVFLEDLGNKHEFFYVNI